MSVIPEAAVEAATKAFRETHFMDDALMNALEAAAPHLRASVGGDSPELAQLIRDESNTYDGRYVVNPDSLADEIMLAGWSK